MQVIPQLNVIRSTKHFNNKQMKPNHIQSAVKITVSATFILSFTNSFAQTNSNDLYIKPTPEDSAFIGSDTAQEEASALNSIVVSSRRRKEQVQNIPIPISVVSGATAAEAGAFNVNRLKELVPTVQLYSSNPRNTTLNIRGLGSTFGLTNDGIDPGVGFYVDGVYYARPAATTLDFIDIERIEVLRGPQGTLFGKNTTAGAFNITTAKPEFTFGGKAELSYGNFGFVQAKASVTGALSKQVATRFSFSGTQRDGLIYNVATQKHTNDLNNLGAKTQFLYQPNNRVSLLLSSDFSRQRPDGFAQVYAGSVQTQRAAYRQFENIIKDLNYSLPSQNPFDRLIDHNTTWRSDNDLGGVSLNLDIELGNGTLTSTSAWRYWQWGPSNDRDFTGLEVLKLSQAPSVHHQWSQELRYSGELSRKTKIVAGAFFIGQDLRSSPYHTEESGKDQWRFSQSSTSPLWQTPGLLDGYGIKTSSSLNALSTAVFANLDWQLSSYFFVLPGIRLNYDKKSITFERSTYGGLATTDPDLLAIKNQVYSNQAFEANVGNTNISGNLTLQYRRNNNFNAYATFTTGYKPVGMNLGGLPAQNGEAMLELAAVKPEYVNHVEIGVKTKPSQQSVLNFTVFNTAVKDYQTQVQTAELGVNRGYLANAEQVRVSGAELEGNIRLMNRISFYGSLAYTDGKYVSFKNAPVPLEETGAAQAFKDISGGRLPGISTWAASYGGEYGIKGHLLEQEGSYYLAVDAFYRSAFSSSNTPSRFLNIEAYTLVNARIGFRTSAAFSANLWVRNLLDKNYFEQLMPAAGNAGHYAAVLGDQRTYGITLRYQF